jgi:hypothetical protein
VSLLFFILTVNHQSKTIFSQNLFWQEWYWRFKLFIFDILELWIYLWYDMWVSRSNCSGSHIWSYSKNQSQELLLHDIHFLALLVTGLQNDNCCYGTLHDRILSSLFSKFILIAHVYFTIYLHYHKILLLPFPNFCGAPFVFAN